MSDEASGWVVEVMGQGMDVHHRRYLVNIADRAKAVEAVGLLVGAEAEIRSSTKVSAEMLEIAGVRSGKVALVQG